jgi:hypothetical protein
MVGVAGECKPAIPLRSRLERGHPTEMAYAVLRHRLGMSPDAHQERFRSDAEQIPELLPNGAAHRIVVEAGAVGLERAADEARERRARPPAPAPDTLMLENEAAIRRRPWRGD